MPTKSVPGKIAGYGVSVGAYSTASQIEYAALADVSPPPPPPPPPPPEAQLTPFDYTVTLLSQYANSPRLLALIDSFNASAGQSGNINDWYDLVWNVDTAQGYGLEVWGRIVGVGNVIQLPANITQRTFGFAEAGTASVTGFNQEPFYPGPRVLQSTQVSDKIFRRMIMAKAFSNISDRSIPSINNALMILFPNNGNAYCTDTGDMTTTFTFTWRLRQADVAILKQTGVVPGPTGVQVLIQDTTGYR